MRHDHQRLTCRILPDGGCARREDLADDRMIVEGGSHPDLYRGRDRLHAVLGGPRSVSCVRLTATAGAVAHAREGREREGATGRCPSRYSVDVITELHEETKSGTATM